MLCMFAMNVKEKTKLHLTESLQKEIQSYTTCDFESMLKSKTQNPKLKKKKIKKLKIQN